ncbi:D-alanyl-lipoteichoic acid biosynthesis protein DltD [Neobacillus mesonae]|uniref:D-alanyl-lipoteichoic acid biosynthesis protein DltD n=1 Tax=Neobacillus mesonae TaxID=1193713 RepID=UPI002573AD0E|nr:D-alanyl-lipoteichoic acid biosynthesis protein DltD [Neobacillus mesonae]MED4205168.1 D-alanyl-lipoteichoic acid biosynthesis protein DltD [Neobacillus mesonae]
MKKAVFSPIIAAFLVLVILAAIPNQWVEHIIPKNRVEEAATELNPFMFQGKYVQQKMLEDKHFLPMYGSSELARLDRFHPSNYFQETGADFTPFLIGRGGTTSITHFLNFAEHTKQLKGKKIIFIVSPQWFQPKGTDETHFVPNYSSLQGYDLAFNNTINPKLKKAAIKRLLTYSPIRKDPILSTMYKAEISNNPWTKRKSALVRPIALVYRDILVKKDLYYTLAGGKPHKRALSPKVKHRTWKRLADQAERYGKRRATNNEFYVTNGQYNKIRKMVPSMKDQKAGASYGKSIEYRDFQMVLDLLKDAGAEPLFISIPVNGKWYDYTGFPKKGRTVYYEKIKKQIEAEGFAFADFSEHEYDPYFLKDTIHIGWKGWVYTDKAIQDFYEGKTKNLNTLVN